MILKPRTIVILRHLAMALVLTLKRCAKAIFEVLALCIMALHFGINKVPQEKKQQASIFKEYEPGYLHIDYLACKSFDLEHTC
jgi:hypothetical protein